MKTEIKEFIKEQHAEACGEWKVKIEEKFPEVFKSELEVGKWYNTLWYGKYYIICITKIENRIKPNRVWHNHYGFMNGEWRGENSWANTEMTKTLTPATDKEVEEALIAEAKRRGFKEGVKFDCAATPRTNCIQGSDVWEFYPKDNTLSAYNSQFMFSKGKWATIIEEEETVWSISAKQNLIETTDVQASLEKIEAILTEIKLKL